MIWKFIRMVLIKKNNNARVWPLVFDEYIVTDKYLKECECSSHWWSYVPEILPPYSRLDDMM